MLGSDVENNPLYPSLSVIDWSGNSHHVRLGQLRGGVCKRKQKSVQKKVETEVELTLFY